MFSKLLRNTIGQWSLEQKCLLFFGLGLLFSICGSFWIVQKVADDLAMETTRQAARSFADNQIAWRHVSIGSSKQAIHSTPYPQNQGFSTAILEQMRKILVDNPQFEMEILALDDGRMHFDLDNAAEPLVTERAILESLQAKYRRVWIEKGRASALEQQAIEPTKSSDVIQNLPPQGDVLTGLGVPKIPVIAPIFLEAGPVNGKYVYYHLVRFDTLRSCANCHGVKSSYADTRQGVPDTKEPFPKDQSGLGSQEISIFLNPEFTSENAPFRVARVSIPYESTRVSALWMLAIMIAVAMVTIAVTLLIFHLILRRLVIKPLRHLRNVSDEISRGKYDLRAKIGTDDEFNELAEAFNRMLRHLTETQDKLRSLNSELDVKVDQLAQANFNLYEANRLKSDFLANMSHELRTPLNSIIGFSDVLHDISSLTEKQKRYAANIQKSGRTLLEMINDILDLAKVEAGKMEVRPTTFDFGQVVHAQCDMMRSLSEEKNIDLQVEVQVDLELVFQDQPKIQQVLTNLLSNAIKFTPEGGLINVFANSSGANHFSFTVNDTGVGIPESDFDVIFEKFRQSTAILEGDNLARRFSGTGLGLSIVKELCKLLGGEVQLTSELGKGSTFSVTLPNQYSPTATAEIAHSQLPALKAS